MIRLGFGFPAENLLLTEDHKTVKLADFGLAREESLTEMMTAETGTYRWMAPEVVYQMYFLLPIFHILNAFAESISRCFRVVCVLAL